MHQLLAEVLSQVRGAWRFRWHAVALAWAIAIAGWLVVMAMRDTYAARARIYIDTESVLRPLLAGIAVDTDVGGQINLMSSVLLSRPNLEKVARQTDLYLRAETPTALEQLIDRLAMTIELQGGGLDSTYTITYTDYDRVMAQRVVQTLLTTFVEDTLGIKRADSTSAQRFLEEQIAEYDKRLREAEDRLATFKRQNVGMMPGETGDYYTRLQTTMAQLEELRNKVRLATERRNELLRQLEGEEPSFGLAPGSSTLRTSPLDVKIAEHQQRLDALLLQFTEKHPDVIALKATIEQLEQQKNARQPGDPVPLAPPEDATKLAMRALTVNPVFHSMKISLSQTELELVDLRNRLAEQERVYNQLRSRVNTIPEVEAQLVRLNRDYEVNRAQHAALLQRLESARLSEDAERSKESVKFRIVEPPLAPLKPVGPNRIQLLSGVIVVAIGAAAALAMLLNQLSPVFNTRTALRQATGLPVLSAISLIPTAGSDALLRRQPVLVAGAIGALVILYVISMLLASRMGGLLQALAS